MALVFNVQLKPPLVGGILTTPFVKDISDQVFAAIAGVIMDKAVRNTKVFAVGDNGHE